MTEKMVPVHKKRKEKKRKKYKKQKTNAAYFHAKHFGFSVNRSSCAKFEPSTYRLHMYWESTEVKNKELCLCK